jgi:hypothetical protein
MKNPGIDSGIFDVVTEMILLFQNAIIVGGICTEVNIEMEFA